MAHQGQAANGGRRSSVVSQEQVEEIGSYALGQTVGAGSYAEIRLAQHLMDKNKSVAIKCVLKEKIKVANLYREWNLWCNLNHPNVLRADEMLEDEHYVYIVMEYVDGGDLLGFIKRHRDGLSEDVIKPLFYQITQGVQYVHTQSVVHKDIKLENVLVTAAGVPKLGDFGLSRTIPPDGELLTGEFQGTLHYAAPQLCLSKPYRGPELDVWALGCLLYAMVCRRLAFAAPDHRQVRHKILRADINPFPSGVSAECRELIKAMLTFSVDERITTQGILESAWLAPVHQVEVARAAQREQEALSRARAAFEQAQRDRALAEAALEEQLKRERLMLAQESAASFAARLAQARADAARNPTDASLQQAAAELAAGSAAAQREVAALTNGGDGGNAVVDMNDDSSASSVNQDKEKLKEKDVDMTDTTTTSGGAASRTSAGSSTGSAAAAAAAAAAPNRSMQGIDLRRDTKHRSGSRRPSLMTQAADRRRSLLVNNASTAGTRESRDTLVRRTSLANGSARRSSVTAVRDMESPRYSRRQSVQFADAANAASATNATSSSSSSSPSPSAAPVVDQKAAIAAAMAAQRSAAVAAAAAAAAAAPSSSSSASAAAAAAAAAAATGAAPAPAVERRASISSTHPQQGEQWLNLNRRKSAEGEDIVEVHFSGEAGNRHHSIGMTSLLNKFIHRLGIADKHSSSSSKKSRKATVSQESTPSTADQFADWSAEVHRIPPTTQ